MTQTYSASRPATRPAGHFRARQARPLNHELTVVRVEVGKRGDNVGRTVDRKVVLFKYPPMVPTGTWVACTLLEDRGGHLFADCLMPFRRLLYNIPGPGLVQIKAATPEEAEAHVEGELARAKLADRPRTPPTA